jgi:hypothetical protein
MNTASTHALVTQLGALQHELETLGYRLDCEGNRDAADVAVTSAARIRDLVESHRSADFFQAAVRNPNACSSSML